MSTLPTSSTRAPYAWARRGDVNAFFGLMLDNVGDMILMATLLVAVFGFPRDFVLTRMIPGTALGVLTGDLLFTAMAFRLARRSGRGDVTAMPLGLDTPSTFGSTFLVLGPAFLAAKAKGFGPEAAAREAWYVGIAMILASGVFKLICSTAGGWLRRAVPRAGLLGSLAAVALVLISFLPLLSIVRMPIAGMAALAVILVTLTARWRLPRDVPGALVAVVIGCLIYYLMYALGLGPGPGGAGEVERPSSGLRAALPIPAADWLEWFQGSWRETLTYLPVAIPLALATVIGGIDCTESAASVGDEFPTGLILAGDGVATLVGGIFGGVIQSTPYIGHPAYKAMGGRAAYTLATGLFVASAGVFGFFGWIFYYLPEAAVFPILIFVGLEITAQSFHATPVRHYPAVALACVPALAFLATYAANQILPEAKPFGELRESTRHLVQTLTMLSGGFIVTSLLWGSTLAHLIDGRLRPAFACLVIAGGCSLFGIIHSPLASGPIAPPSEVIRQLKEQGRYEATSNQTPYHWAAAYGVAAALLLGLGRSGTPPTSEVGRMVESAK